MTGNRIAFVSAVSLAILALFVLSGAEGAQPVLNDPFILPDDSRVDGNVPMSFGVNYTDAEGDFPSSFIVKFDGVSVEIDMVCNEAGCLSLVSPNGTWTVEDGSEPLASSLVANIGGDEIGYNFEATTSGEDDSCYLVCEHWISSGVRVNTLPILTDNAAVVGDGMPEDSYTLTVTYTDADGNAGVVTANVCDQSSTCETLSLSTADTDFTAGADYSVIFNTNLGGNLDVTVSATDGHDSAVDNRTTSFSVDTETPWLKNPSVSSTSGGENDVITFSIVYCVFDATGTGDPTLGLQVGSTSGLVLSSGENNSACKNGVDYTINTTIAWSASSQAVTFSAFNDNASASGVSGSSVTINDAPTLSAGSAELHFDGETFVLNVTAADINENDGDAFTVYATIEFDEEIEMTCSSLGDYSNCTLDVDEGDIITQRGGPRDVTFRVVDRYWINTTGDFGNSITVTKTSSFDLTGPGDQAPQPDSLNSYTFTIVNNGNFEDTFDIEAVSLNDWIHESTTSILTVPYASSGTFTVVMDVPNIAAGTNDTWNVDVTARNNDGESDNIDGLSTVAVASGHTVSIDSDASDNADPGSTATYYFTITNTGNADDSFAYTTDGTPSSGSTNSLGMGESQTFEVSHTVPAVAAAGSTFTLTFDSGSKSASATTTTNQVYGVSITQTGGTEPSSINPGASFVIEYTVTNTGNGADTVSVSFNGDWASGSETLNLAADASGTATATISVPSDAAGNSGSSVSSSAFGLGSSAISGSYDMTIASDSRSFTLDATYPSAINKGDVGTGTLTVTNTGVDATFVVTSTSGLPVTFATSEITLGGSTNSGTLSFTIHATGSGTFTITMEDDIDGSSADFTSGTVTANEFDSAVLTTSTDDCGTGSITCTPDPDGGWDGTQYTLSGTWSTTMTAADSNGMTGSHTFTTVKNNLPPSFAAPSSLDDATAGDAQTFTFNVPSDSDGDVTHFVIDFGDGNSQTFEGSDLDGNTITATHTYESAGDFDVVATAYDNSGAPTVQAVAITVGERTVTMDGSSYTYNLVALLGFFVLGILLAGTAFKLQQGEIAGDEEMNERDRQRLESVERRMESLAEREELLEVSAYDASRAATKLEEHISAFNGVLVRAQEIAAEDKLKELEAAETAREKEEEQMQLDLEDPDIEMVAERFHDSLGRLVKARDELSKIEEQLAHILKMERDEQLEKLTSMTESYETTKRKIDALQSTKEARDAAAEESRCFRQC